MQKKGFLVTIASPSGGGKSSIINEVLRINPSFCYSISTTTRPIRGEEVDGQHYFFIDVETFKQKIAAGFFLEYAEVHSNYYGTSKEFIDSCISQEKIVLLDIDVQGVELIKKSGYHIVSIFILPPDLATLKHRLVNRGTDSAEVIAKRLDNAKKEISYLPDYDYLVINDDMNEAIQVVNSILIAEQNRVNSYVEPEKTFYSKT